MASGPAAAIRHRAKRGIIRQVRALFNDQARGERPVQRSADALFAPGSPIQRVHGDVTSMMVGGVAALLLQMLHPAVLAGVWDHSNFRTDMIGRLRRTARFIAVTTYAERDQAVAAMEKVRAVHAHIAGITTDGTPYRADDPHLLAWVHVTEALSFLDGWQRYGSRPLTAMEEDHYFADFATIAAALGADPVPRTRAEATALVTALRPELHTDDRTREVARIVLGHMPGNVLAIPLQAVTMQAAVDLLPDWARAMHGLPTPPAIVRPLVRTGATGIARTLRWAFAD